MDPRKHNHGYGMPGPGSADWQQVLNESWPLVESDGKPHARGIPRRDPIAVRARVVFEHDGETWLDGHAVRWHGRCVRVEADDPRLMSRGVWVDAGDVRRCDAPTG